jgi:excisionase family DNA binding protein
VPEAARILGISRSHAYEMIQLDRLCGVRLGRRIVVPVRSIEEMLQARVSRSDRRGELLVARQRPDELSSRPPKRTLID